MKKILNAISDFADFITNNFGFSDFHDFFNSLVHTKLLLFTFPLSIAIFGLVEKWLGLSSAIFVSFGVTAGVELITGLVGARAQKKKLSSRKFSRFGLKILVWMSLILMANSFKTTYEGLEGLQNIIIFQMFYWIHGTLVVYICMEYMISILENFGKITGKGDNKLLGFLKKKLDQWFETADEMSDPNKIMGAKPSNNAPKIGLDSDLREDNEEVGETP